MVLESADPGCWWVKHLQIGADLWNSVKEDDKFQSHLDSSWISYPLLKVLLIYCINTVEKTQICINN